MKRPMMWFCLVGIFLIYLYSGIRMQVYSPPDLSGKITVTGRVMKKEIRNGRLILYLKNTKLNSKQSGSSAGEKSKGFICYMKEIEGGEPTLCETAPIGSNVVLYGDVSLCKKAGNPGEFDAYAYYGARGYYYTLYDADIKYEGKGIFFFDALICLREKCVYALVSQFGEKDGGVLGAMLFGDKRYLPEDLKEIYAGSGISHILAISGLHISLIGVFLYAICNRSFLSSKASFFVVAGILVLYGFMVGYAPSVFRAVFMFSARILAKTLQKPYDAPTALSLSAFLTCLFFPGLTTDSSFLLTYLAVAGILFLSPVFLSSVNRRKNIFDAFGVSGSVFAATLPVVALSSEEITFSGIILNLVVLPAMPVLFVVSFLTILCGNRIPFLASVFATVGKSILFSFSEAGEFLMRLKFTSVCVKAPGVGRIVIYTTLVVLFGILFSSFRRKMRLTYYRMMNRKLLGTGQRECKDRNGEKGEREGKGEERRGKFEREELDEKEERYTERGFILVEKLYHIVFAGILIALVVFLLSTPKTSAVTFLDVGQGDGIFIRTKEGRVFMVDGGSTSKNNVGEKIIEKYLLYEGEKEVDLWFLTHNDSDHVNGFLEVLKGDTIRIKKLAVPEVAKDDFKEVTDLAKERGCEVLYLNAGDLVSEQDGGYCFTVVAPDSRKPYEDRNAASLVLYYEEGSFRIALMGDSREDAEQPLVEAINGSQTSLADSSDTSIADSPENLNVASPVDFSKKINHSVDFSKDTNHIILKCAHHGSANGSNSEWLYENLQPEICIVSSGKNNVYGHPHKEVLERIASVDSKMFNTADYGAIILTKNIFGKRRIRLFLKKKSFLV